MEVWKHKAVPILKKLKFHILSFILLFVLGAVFYYVQRATLLRNYQDIGTLLAQDYAKEAEGELDTFRALLDFGAEGVDARTREGASADEIRDWLRGYCEQIRQVFGEKITDPLAVCEGEPVTADSPEASAIGKAAAGTAAVSETAAEETAAYLSSSWYQAALEAGGRVIFTDAYESTDTGREVITIARRCGESDTVLAFHVYPENLIFSMDESTMMDNASVYVCDTAGTLLYEKTILQCSREELLEYLDRLQDGVRDGRYETYDSYAIDVEGNRRGVYHTTISNGWGIIVTVPFNEILSRLNLYTVLYALLMAVAGAAFFFMTLRNLKLDLMMERVDEAARVLGNYYYALYRVNYRDNTYEMLKGSEYVRNRLPANGPYPELLRVAGEVMKTDAFQDFQESFSMVSIRNLVDRRIRDYGGDFLRLFGKEYRWVSVRVLYDESLPGDEVVLCFREVEQEKNQQLRERQLLEEALESSRHSEQSKHAFFNNMSHDMRTPLNAILGLADLLGQNAEDAEKVRDYTKKITYSSRQLLDLVNDILEMSRMEQGKVILNHEAFNLEECVRECAETFRIQAEREKKAFRVEVDVQDTVVMGDSTRMRQILNNLLSNAFKFTSEGDMVSAALRQIRDAGRTRSQYQLVIKDTGIGMSEDFLPHLFEPYSRENRFSSRQISGTGLGMPIVKNLVVQMSGKIYVDSRPGEGTVFTVTVPFVPAADEEKSTLSGEAEETSGQEFFSLTGKKVILAEDNEINMEIAAEILKMNGLDVRQAWDGQEAVELFQKSALFEIDAILMDMQMPVMGGCEAARRIRALPRSDAKQVPILAVTANAFAEDIAATTAAGMDAHISKPIDYKVLCRTLEQLTQKKGGK